MSKTPKLSFIVLSYNYDRFIGATIDSILKQTIQDFEIVIVDDASQDRSLEVIRTFDDPRIRLLVNEKNLGGAGSYNRAVEAAVGEWLVNLDADDWISPHKSEIQLQAAALDPKLDIIGTYVNFVDENGAPHPGAAEAEAFCNAPHDFNRVDTWIGANRLCRSSTMVRRAAHLRIGLDDPGMVRAPDYELWTRALRHGCRFAVIPERLTFSRMHSGGVTHGSPTETMLEMSYAMLRNLVPLAEARGLNPSLDRMVRWVAGHPQLSWLPPVEAHRLLGMIMALPELDEFAAFRAMLSEKNDVSMLALIGRRTLSIVEDGDQHLTQNTVPKQRRKVFSRRISNAYKKLLREYISKLEWEVEACIYARDYWHSRYESLRINPRSEQKHTFHRKRRRQWLSHWVRKTCSYLFRIGFVSYNSALSAYAFKLEREIDAYGDAECYWYKQHKCLHKTLYRNIEKDAI